MAATINRGITVPAGSPGGNSSALNITATGLVISGQHLLGSIISSTSGTLTVNDCASSPTTANQVSSVSVTAGVPVWFYMFPFFTGIYLSAIPASAVITLSFS